MKVLRLPPSRIAGLVAVIVGLVVSSGALLRAQGGGPVLTANPPLGPNVSFTWTAVPTASSYVLWAGVAPGQYSLSLNLGNTTNYEAAAPAVGTYYVRVDAVTSGGTLPSNEVTVQIQSMFVPPTAPTDLQAYLNGRHVTFAWTPGVGGGAPTAFYLEAGTTAGGAEFGRFPVGGASQVNIPNVAPGPYFVRVLAYNNGGFSPASNEVEFTMTAEGVCTPPPAQTFTPRVFGNFVQLTWPGIAGAAGYRLDVAYTPGGAPAVQQGFGPATTRFSVSRVANGVYYGRLTSVFTCGSESAGPEVPVTVDGAPPPGPRTPNPAPGTLLPLPNMSGVVRQLAAERPDLLRDSCREHGGNNRFLFELVRRLRQVDNRWGLNWKRGIFNDMSQDIVDYNASDQSDEGAQSPAIYIVDVIGGHCGPNPGPNWEDVTRLTAERGAVGIWTLLPYLDAGMPLDTPQQ